VSTAYGDSGGPSLARGSNGEWRLAGITSDGTTDVCAAGPSIYLSVPAAKSWIHQVTGQ
jgi:secreted trypsin-like serine protease